MLCSNIGINESGHLTFAGEDTVRLAAHYKTPLYLMDEDRIRENCRVYKAAMARAFGEGSFPLYASKAASFKRIYAIMQDEGMAIDVVSAGEIATAKRAGFQMERAFFHGNNKTDADISYAMAANVGYFVADHAQELEVISREAKSRGIRQKVLLRLTPGIDPHTYEAVATGSGSPSVGCWEDSGRGGQNPLPARFRLRRRIWSQPCRWRRLHRCAGRCPASDAAAPSAGCPGFLPRG